MPVSESVSDRRSFIIKATSGKTLEWMAGPDCDLNWFQACKWVEELDDAGWRMPSVDELNELTDLVIKGLGGSGWWVWSDEADGPLSAKGLDINLGQIYSGGRELDSGGRVFAVR